MKLTVSLNGNFRCPFQAFVDIARQLSPATALSKLVFSPVCELNTINDWINLESLGQPAAIRAQALCARLQALLHDQGITQLSLAVKTTQGVLGSDNLYLFLFLNRVIKTQFIFYVDEACQPLLQQTLATVAEEQWTIDYQAAVAGEAPDEYHETLLKAVGFDLQFADTATCSDAAIQRLIGYAWVCLKAGAPEAGRDALARIINQVPLSVPQRETLFLHLQLTRFLAHCYDEVTAEVFPEAFVSLDKNDITSLHFITAYSATLTRNLTVAEHHFKQCQVHEDMPLGDENSLYRLNLYALFLVLQGREDTALKLEMRIKQFIDDHHVAITGLNYVNYINIARLYKKAKQFDQALSYYGLAYEELSGGGYTLYDFIYYNMNIGAIQEATGHYSNALDLWMNAALAWLACDNPYALSWRPRLILCQEKITEIARPLSIAQVDGFLYDKITTLLAQSGMTVPTNGRANYVFTTKKGAVRACYIHHNLIVYDVTPSPAFTQPIGSSRQALSALVSSILKQIMAIPAHQATLLVDMDQEGRYPSSREQALRIAALKGCDSCYYNGTLLTVNQAEKQALLESVQVTLSPAISTIHVADGTMRLHYNRSFLNKALNDDGEMALVTRLQRQESVQYTQLTANEQLILRSLVEKNVIVFHDPLLLKNRVAMPELSEG